MTTRSMRRALSLLKPCNNADIDPNNVCNSDYSDCLVFAGYGDGICVNVELCLTDSCSHSHKVACPNLHPNFTNCAFDECGESEANYTSCFEPIIGAEEEEDFHQFSEEDEDFHQFSEGDEDFHRFPGRRRPSTASSVVTLSTTSLFLLALSMLI